jgi:hypothetical protein
MMEEKGTMAKRKYAKHHVQLQTLRVSWTDSRRTSETLLPDITKVHRTNP